MKTSYPLIPTVPYKPTRISMPEAVLAIQKLPVPAEVKRATYIVFRNESANGTKGLNNNFGGIQTDGARWPAKYDKLIIANVEKTENGTGNIRAFAAFATPEDFFYVLSDRLKDRGIYVGGDTSHITHEHVDTPEELARIYKKEWVRGDKTAEPDATELSNFLSMYRQAAKIFV